VACHASHGGTDGGEGDYARGLQPERPTLRLGGRETWRGIGQSVHPRDMGSMTRRLKRGQE